MKRKIKDLAPRDKMLSVANGSILNREFQHFNCKTYEEKKHHLRMKNYSDASCIILTFIFFKTYAGILIWPYCNVKPLNLLKFSIFVAIAHIEISA